MTIKNLPSPFAILFSMLILVSLLGLIIPKGSYSTLIYQPQNDVFVETIPNQPTSTLPATNATLNSLNIPLDTASFKKNFNKKPIVIPNTYQRINNIERGYPNIFKAIVKGFYQSVDIGFFILLLGAVIGLLTQSKAINASFSALAQKTGDNTSLLIISLFILIAIGGTTFGMVEEIATLLPVLIPLFLLKKLDTMTGLATLYVSSMVGFMFSTLNVFGVGVGSVAAGTNYLNGISYHLVGLVGATIISIVYIIRYAKKVIANPQLSYVYDYQYPFTEGNKTQEPQLQMNLPQLLQMVLFLVAFIGMMWGIISKDYWFDEISSIFLMLVISLVIMNVFILKYSEKETLGHLFEGMGDMLSVLLLIAISNAIYFILQDMMILDTIIYQATLLLSHIHPVVYLLLIYVVYMVLGIFINSASSLAYLSLPLFAPLGEQIGVNKDVTVSAYLYGHRVISLISPIGYIMIFSAMVGIPFHKWLKFILPLFFLLTLFGFLILLMEYYNLLALFHG